MDTLVSVGSTAAYVMSLVATFLPQSVGVTFYDTTALIVTLITVNGSAGTVFIEQTVDA